MHLSFKMADGDYEEEEVWSCMKECSPKNSSKRGKSTSFFSSSSRRHPSSSKNVPKSNGSAEESFRKCRQSVPVNIPNWSKVYNNEDDDDEYEGEKIPPHEWIANKLARSQISSFSVCEGAGRTLKGRDQRKVRDAVLSKTGFIE